jgi:superfamily I DNA and/or RNA helicase
LSWLSIDPDKQRVIEWRLKGGLGTLIGPPGTGKTKAGAGESIAAQIEEGERSLLVAYTNAAANEFCREICELLGPETAKEMAIRTGQLEGYQPTPTCPIEFTLDPYKIRQKPIVVTTTLSATDKYLPRDIVFDRVIEDETGIERLEHILIPLKYCVDAGVRRRILRERDPFYDAEEPSREVQNLLDLLGDYDVTATFIGDPKQSKPISPESRDYSAITYTAARTTTEMLKTTYRLPFNIDLIVDEFANYGGLRAHPSVKNRRLRLLRSPESPFVKKLLDPEPVVTYINVKGQEQPEGVSSYSNPMEVKVVVRLAQQIYNCTKRETSVMAITIYKEQRKLISRYARSLGIPLDSRTTTAALGAQADVVIVSQTRNNPNLELGAVGVLQDLNVAISRARRKLFIVGNWDMLEQGWITLPTLHSRGWHGVSWKLARLIEKYGDSPVETPPQLIH